MKVGRLVPPITWTPVTVTFETKQELINVIATMEYYLSINVAHQTFVQLKALKACL